MSDSAALPGLMLTREHYALLAVADDNPHGAPAAALRLHAEFYLDGPPAATKAESEVRNEQATDLIQELVQEGLLSSVEDDFNFTIWRITPAGHAARQQADAILAPYQFSFTKLIGCEGLTHGQVTDLLAELDDVATEAIQTFLAQKAADQKTERESS